MCPRPAGGAGPDSREAQVAVVPEVKLKPVYVWVCPYCGRQNVSESVNDGNDRCFHCTAEVKPVTSW